MDKSTIEQYVQEFKKFMAQPCYDYLRNEYNKRVIKKLEELHRASITDNENAIRIKSGEISGFKNGFELIEALINEFERKEGK